MPELAPTRPEMTSSRIACCNSRPLNSRPCQSDLLKRPSDRYRRGERRTHPERPDRNSWSGIAAVIRCGLRQRSTLRLVARTRAEGLIHLLNPCGQSDAARRGIAVALR